MERMVLEEKTIDEVISRLKKPMNVMPPDEKIVEAVRSSPDALTALWRLRLMGYAKPECQLALQRASDRKLIVIGPDWKLSAAA